MVGNLVHEQLLFGALLRVAKVFLSKLGAADGAVFVLLEPLLEAV